MVEIAHKRLSVLRERVGIRYVSDRGVNASPADVDEAVRKLKSDLRRTQDFHKGPQSGDAEASPDVGMDVEDEAADGASSKPTGNGVNDSYIDGEPPFMQGRLVHRTEPDLKTHTSYLVFAVLPREWDEASEAAAMARWPCGKEKKTIGNLDKQARKQEKREMLAGKRKKKQKVDSPAPAPPA